MVDQILTSNQVSFLSPSLHDIAALANPSDCSLCELVGGNAEGEDIQYLAHAIAHLQSQIGMMTDAVNLNLLGNGYKVDASKWWTCKAIKSITVSIGESRFSRLVNL